jgi:uncharacterized protein
MTSYGSPPRSQRAASEPVTPPAGEQQPGRGAGPGSGPEWQTGPQAPWHTPPGAPWPDGPGWQSQRRPGDQEPPTGQWRATDQEPPTGQWQVTPGGQEPAREQWSAQLRKQAPAGAQFTAPPGDADERWAMISYLGVPFLGFLAPLAVYLITLRTSRFARHHATQALNLSITVILYNICAVIAGALLALDSIEAALALMVPLLAGLWTVTLTYLVLAAIAASRGGYYKIPAWLCATLVR